MIPQALSSVLLAAAQLHSVEPQVLRLVPAVLPQLPIMVERMVPQAAEKGREIWGTKGGEIQAKSEGKVGNITDIWNM